MMGLLISLTERCADIIVSRFMFMVYLFVSVVTGA